MNDDEKRIKKLQQESKYWFDKSQWYGKECSRLYARVNKLNMKLAKVK